MATTPIGRHTTRRANTRRVNTGRASGKFADSFALLAECLLVGVYVMIASLPVITLPAALAAGVAHVRRHLAGRDTRIGRFARDWWVACGQLWSLGVAAVGLAVVLAGNVRIADSGLLPGGDVARWAAFAAGVVAAILLLRVAGLSAATLADGDRGPARSDDAARAAPPARPTAAPPARGAWGLARHAVRSARDDVAGSLLLGVALGLSGVLVWMLTPLVAIVGGLLCLAVVAVEARHRRSRRTNDLP